MSDSELILTQRRYVTTISGVTKYAIQVTVTRGDDPAVAVSPMTPQVFVMTLGADEFSDTFARVASIADLDLVHSLRYVAVERGHTEYRASKATLSFSDLDTAIAAIPVLKDRVNNLVKVWQQAQTDFINPADTYDLPLGTADLSVQAGLEKAYKEAAEARVAAEKTQADAQLAYAALQTDVDHVKDVKDIHCTYNTKFSQLNSLANYDPILVTAVTALNSATNYFARCTRVADNEKGLVVSATESILTVAANAFTVPPDAVSYENKTVVIVTFSEDGHKEVRFVLDVTSDTLTVSPDFAMTPSAGDKWELHYLTDYLPINDYGATSAAAAAVQAAIDSMASPTGQATLLSQFSNDASASCSSATDAHQDKLDLEHASQVALEQLKAKKDAAQAVENLAAAALLDVCPTVDLESLLK